MKEFGVSVYPDIHSMDEIRDYLRLAGKYGCSYVFSSMFSVEGTNEEVLDLFKGMIETAHEEHMQVVLDLNPYFLNRLGVTYDDVSVLAGIGCDVMRMDVPYGKEKDCVLAKNPYGIKIMFNASMGITEELAYFKENGVESDRVLLGHNFYPQPLTGLKWNSFVESNAKIAEYGFPIQAFVSTHAKDATGVWDATYGLPTVEITRKMDIDLAARLIMATGDVDMVWIGNAFASEEDFQKLEEVFSAPQDVTKSPLFEPMQKIGFQMKQHTSDVKLRVVLDDAVSEQERYQIAELYPQSDFGDSSEWIWRSRAGRFLKPDIPVRTCDKKMFEKGDVLVVNNNYAHYAGEVQIVRIPFENDGIRNYIGHLKENEESLFDLIQDGDVVRFLVEE